MSNSNIAVSNGNGDNVGSNVEKTANVKSSEWNQSQIEVERGELNDTLEAFFKEELEQIAENTLEVTEQREKLSKFSMLSSIEKSADLILCD